MLYNTLIRDVKRKKGWDCILKNISETVGCNLSSEGRMSLGSGKQICLLGVVMTN